MKITPDTKIVTTAADTVAVIADAGILMFGSPEVADKFIGNARNSIKDNRYNEGFKSVVSGSSTNLYLGMITPDNRPVASSNVSFENHSNALIERVKHSPVNPEEVHRMLKDYHTRVANSTHLPEVIQNMYLKSGPKLEDMLLKTYAVMDIFSVVRNDDAYVVQMGYKHHLFGKPEFAKQMAELIGVDRTIRVTLTIYEPTAEPVL